MRWIYQQGETDCGAAALAMIANVDYEVAKAFLMNEAGRNRSISSGYMIKGINKFGRKCVGDRCTAIGERRLYDLDNDALLSGNLLIPIDGGWKRDGHWCVWDSQQQVIRDPYGYVYPYEVERLVEVE